ncbi:MAG: response regulator [Planctomycetes bacterium]|nr:response regulator [Planctomycetota bacterium]
MTSKSQKVLVIDDDPSTVEIQAKLLSRAHFEVEECLDSSQALDKALICKPHYVFCDMMMPNIDGLEVCRQIKSHEELKDISFVMVSSKAYEYDKKQAYLAGADAYITKPFTEEKLNMTLKSLRSKITFWGIHGTLPVPGPQTTKYGGNTSCISVEFSKDRNFIFDAGSGIKPFSDYVMKKSAGKKFNSHIFITHPHWDHINAFPFFTPLFIQGNSIDVYGPKQFDKSMYRIMSDQMDGVYFPVTVQEFGAHVDYHDLGEGVHTIEGIKVETMMLTHPGNCLGYKVTYNGISFCYITDNELYFPDHDSYNDLFYRNLVEFSKGCDYFIHDTTYFDEEYEKKTHWGHSCISQVCLLAHEAEVKNYYLFHHDPDHNDEKIQQKLEVAQSELAKLKSKTKCHIAYEGLELYF